MPEKRLHAIVKGRTQGVCFRDFAKKEALILRLKGYVKNLPDGSVEVIAEGSEEKLGKLLAKLYEGPINAEVIEIEKEVSEAMNEFKTFSISF